MQIYVACLASYNNGVHHGKWIDASSDPDAMQEEINALLMASKFPNVQVSCPDCEGTGENPYGKGCSRCDAQGTVPSAEEWAIHDYDDFGSNLPGLLGEHPSLNLIAEVAELLEEQPDDDMREVVDALAVEYGAAGTDGMRDALNDDFVGIYSSFQEYSDEVADDMLEADKTSQMITQYFDYKAFARDLEMGMAVTELPSGSVAVFHH